MSNGIDLRESVEWFAKMKRQVVNCGLRRHAGKDHCNDSREGPDETRIPGSDLGGNH
ncbi:hypothetical protein OKW29_005221 [Paraburkholderia sp. CI3]